MQFCYPPPPFQDYILSRNKGHTWPFSLLSSSIRYSDTVFMQFLCCSVTYSCLLLCMFLCARLRFKLQNTELIRVCSLSLPHANSGVIKYWEVWKTHGWNLWFKLETQFSGQCPAHQQAGDDTSVCALVFPVFMKTVKKSASHFLLN